MDQQNLDQQGQKSQFEKYVDVNNKQDFYNQQKEKGLGDLQEKGGGFGFLSKEMLNEEFQNRKKTTEFKDRTKYYFEDEDMMKAKAERYRRLVDDGTDIETHAARFSNHSAGKRKKAATAAANAFDQAAQLEKSYREQMIKPDSLGEFQQKKAIMEARLLGMKKAAEVKSTSKENETYRVLKAEISCLSILKEQAQVLSEEESNEDLKKELLKEIRKVNKDLAAAQKKMAKIHPTPQKQWMDQLYSREKLSAQLDKWKENSPDVTVEDLRFDLVLLNFYKEPQKDEFTEALQAVEKQENPVFKNLENDSPYIYEKGKESRELAFGIRAVLKDEEGNPINKEELKKQEQNNDWLKAIKEGDVELKNKVIMNQINYIRNMRIPSPRELQERGVEFYFEKDPALFYDMMTLPGVFDNLTQVDAFALEYKNNHPDFMKKMDAMGQLSGYFMAYLKRHYMFHQETGVVEMSRDDAEAIASDAQVEEFFNLYKNIYDDAFKDPYDVGISGVTFGYLNDEETEALKSYVRNHPDAYDRDMRKRIADPAEQELGQELLKKKSVEELSALTGDAYQTLFNSTLSKSKKLARAETAVEKKKLQMALRNRIENCLIERQMDLAKELVKESDPGEKNPAALRLAGEWPSLKASYDQASVTENIQKAAQILENLDIAGFEYKNDTEFVDRIQDNYRWIQKVDTLRAYCNQAKTEGLVQQLGAALEARLKFFEEMKADYDARIDMMNSPYYALLANADISGLSDDALARKATEAEGTNPELASFLKNYRTLKNRGAFFGKGKNAAARIETIKNTVQQFQPLQQDVEQAIVQETQEEVQIKTNLQSQNTDQQVQNTTQQTRNTTQHTRNTTQNKNLNLYEKRMNRALNAEKEKEQEQEFQQYYKPVESTPEEMDKQLIEIQQQNDFLEYEEHVMGEIDRQKISAVKDLTGLVKNYTGNYFGKYNNALRGMPKEGEEDYLDDANKMKEKMKNLKINRDVMVMREVRGLDTLANMMKLELKEEDKKDPSKLMEAIQKKIGEQKGKDVILSDPGFVSTTYQPGVKFLSQEETGIEFIINVKKGTQAVNVSNASEHDEKEILLNAGTKFKLVKIYYNGTGGEERPLCGEQLDGKKNYSMNKKIWKVYLETIPSNEEGQLKK